MSEVTRILSAIEQGDPRAAAQLLPLVYDELQKNCGQDAELRRRVEMMVVAHDTPQSLLDRLASDAVALESATADLAGPAPEQPGTLIGPYKLHQTIGEGGMGTVLHGRRGHRPGPGRWHRPCRRCHPARR